MLDVIFGGNDIPKEDVYRETQKVIKHYMDTTNKKIEYVAQELGTTAGYLRKQIDPNQPDRPLSIDRIIDITRLTDDTRIINTIAHEVNMIAVCKQQVSVTTKDINHLVDMANIEGSDVFREAKLDLADGYISFDEKERLLQEIKEAQTAYAALENSLKSLKVKEEE